MQSFSLGPGAHPASSYCLQCSEALTPSWCGPSGSLRSVRTDGGSLMAMLGQMDFCMEELGPARQKGRGEYEGQAAGTLRICTGRASTASAPSPWAPKTPSHRGEPASKPDPHQGTEFPRSVPEFLCPEEWRHCTFQVPSVRAARRARRSLLQPILFQLRTAP